MSSPGCELARNGAVAGGDYRTLSVGSTGNQKSKFPKEMPCQNSIKFTIQDACPRPVMLLLHLCHVDFCFRLVQANNVNNNAAGFLELIDLLFQLVTGMP